MTRALVLACLVHLFLGGLVVLEVLRSPAPVHQDSGLVLDLAPLEVHLPTRENLDRGLIRSPMPVIRAQGGIPHDPDHISRDGGQDELLLGRIRQKIMEVWEPVQPPGAGQALVVLEFGSNLQVVHARVVQVQGTGAFVRFMQAFAARLQGLGIAHGDHDGRLRVECEFRVEE
jgi:hypothetical protein